MKKGKIVIEDVPLPPTEKNSILVEVKYSLISPGTETAILKASGESLFKTATKSIDNLKKTVDVVRTLGVDRALAKIRSRIEAAHLAGYSCSGVVREIGDSINDIRIGDRVACAGAGRANHAEFVCIPRNLAVKIPDKIGFREAASATVGAIALQGVRRADLRIGELVAVIGLGLLGQITVQLAKIAGCRVIGIDIDKQRVGKAYSFGMDLGIESDKENLVSKVLNFTNGHGVDTTIITAASSSHLPVAQALEIARKKGRVVVVGDVGLHLQRKHFYEKELDFLIATSYGPGRYDETYEEGGIDYPYAYVRWTENRNMAEYLRLLSEERIDINSLISEVYPIEDAPLAYEALKRESKPLGVLLKYQEKEKNNKSLSTITRKIIVASKTEKGEKIFNVALIGAGNFAQEIRLPCLRKLNNRFHIYAIGDANPIRAKEMARKFQAQVAFSDYREIIEDNDIDLIMICTRHHLHAQMVVEALKAEKHVFVEKPLCLEREELKEIIKTYNSKIGKNLVLHVGFNRRFSPYAKRIKKVIQDRRNPMIVNYRMNAGYLPKDHWVHTEEGGGRNKGEACHIYDLFDYFTENEVSSIEVSAVDPQTDFYLRSDNFVASMKFKEGSVCNLVYTSLGANSFSKEQMEIYIDGKIICLDDYKRLSIWGAKNRGLKTKRQEKGYLEELMDFADCINAGESSLIPLWQLVQACEISFEVDEKINK